MEEEKEMEVFLKKGMNALLVVSILLGITKTVMASPTSTNEIYTKINQEKESSILNEEDLFKIDFYNKDTRELEEVVVDLGYDSTIAEVI